MIRALLFASLFILGGCSHKSASDEWSGMDDFHFILAECYHPYADSSNLEPALANKGALASAAAAWAHEDLPEKVNTDEVRSTLDNIVEQTQAFAKLDPADTTNARRLTEIHGLFHELQEAWYGSESH